MPIQARSNPWDRKEQGKTLILMLSLINYSMTTCTRASFTQWFGLLLDLSLKWPGDAG